MSERRKHGKELAGEKQPIGLPAFLEEAPACVVFTSKKKNARFFPAFSGEGENQTANPEAVKVLKQRIPLLKSELRSTRMFLEILRRDPESSKRLIKLGKLEQARQIIAEYTRPVREDSKMVAVRIKRVPTSGPKTVKVRILESKREQ
jgi:hypothetical protein